MVQNANHPPASEGRQYIAQYEQYPQTQEYDQAPATTYGFPQKPAAYGYPQQTVTTAPVPGEYPQTEVYNQAPGAAYGFPKPPAAPVPGGFNPPANAANSGPGNIPPENVVIINTTSVNTVEEPDCKCGIGWILFGIGWFAYLAWLIGAILFCLPHKKTDRPGLLGCLIMAIVGGLIIIIAIAASSNAST